MRPFYSQALGNFVAAQARPQIMEDDDATTTPHKKSFEVVEMGGGRATNASIILSHLQDHHPDVYDRLDSYTLIDASPSLLELQEETMKAGQHYDKMKFELKDMIDVAENKVPFLTPSETPTVLLTCELLDNLPHDKVRVKAGRVFEQGEIIIASEETTGNDNNQQLVQDGGDNMDSPLWKETFVPLADPLLSKVLKLAPSTYTRSSMITWIPSVACGVLHRLHQERPNSTIMMADFDWLPPPDLRDETQESLSVWAPGEPIITDMKGVDHACYLRAPPNCDILFPTDFPKLASFVSESWNISDSRSSKNKSNNNSPSLQVDVLKQSDFLEKYGPEEVKATKSWLTGFSPMLHDFGNCSALTVTRRGKLLDSQVDDDGQSASGNLPKRKGRQTKRRQRQRLGN